MRSGNPTRNTLAGALAALEVVRVLCLPAVVWGDQSGHCLVVFR